VRVLLPDGPLGKAVLLCRRKKDDGSWAGIVKEYDMPSQRWVTVREGMADGSRSLLSG
jgi:hypothetical protein